LAQSVGNADVANASRERAMQIHYQETNEGHSTIHTFFYKINQKVSIKHTTKQKH